VQELLVVLGGIVILAQDGTQRIEPPHYGCEGFGGHVIDHGREVGVRELSQASVEAPKHPIAPCGTPPYHADNGEDHEGNDCQPKAAVAH
jgi:hypothetical protein